MDITHLQKIARLGGLARVKQARFRYDSSPHYCLCCHSSILSTPNQPLAATRKKKFCNRSCAAKYNNKHYPPKVKRKYKICVSCSMQFYAHGSKKYCSNCKEQLMLKISGRCKKDVHRSSITSHARYILNRLKNIKKECFNCHILRPLEACHKKPVSIFPDNALLTEINNPTNLIWLCLNHHWDYDHNYITLSSPGIENRTQSPRL